MDSQLSENDPKRLVKTESAKRQAILVDLHIAKAI